MTDAVAAVHFTPAYGEVETNRHALVALAAEAAERARLVVFPELSTTGFCMGRAEAEAWAEPLEGPTVEALRTVATHSGAVVVLGLALRDPLRNAQVVIDGGTTCCPIQVYTKHHLYEDDFNWAVAGDAPGAVVQTSLGALGLLICHDIVYPNTVLAVARQRPTVLAFSTAWIGDPDPVGVPESWRSVAQLLSPAPLVVANRGGAEGAVRFQDPSAVLAGSGGVVGTAGRHSQILYGALAS